MNKRNFKKKKKLIPITIQKTLSPCSRSKKKSSNSSVTEEGDVLEHFVDAVAISNRRGIITFFNAAAETMFGWPREEVIGKNVSILMVEAVGSRHNAYMRRYRRFCLEQILSLLILAVLLIF